VVIGYSATTETIGITVAADATRQTVIGTVAQTSCFLHGVRGITTENADAIAVLVDSAGQLGTVSSSLRYKENVVDMSDFSSRLGDLRPVLFQWRPEHNASRKVQIGLIAEEVAESFPELAILNSDGSPETVAYQNIPVLLLNEHQKLKSVVASLSSEVENLKQIIAGLLASV
jgi:hypothetical protein